jgi:hypothetical protein
LWGDAIERAFGAPVLLEQIETALLHGRRERVEDVP